jgi:hypothetical protein
MRRLIASFTIALLSSAAFADGPVVSANAISQSEPHEWVLSPEQVHLLDAWLNEHRKGWRANLATPPAAALSVQMKHSDGTERSIEFFDQPGWSGSVIIRGRVASFPAADLARLRQQLGEGGGK